MNKKLILLALVGVGIALFYFFDLQQHLSLQSLKTNRDKLDMIYQENSLAIIFVLVVSFYIRLGFGYYPPNDLLLVIFGSPIVAIPIFNNLLV